jgi:hypothetical protein
MHTIGEISVVRFDELERVATFSRLYEVAHYISRRVSEEWLLEAVIEPTFHFQEASKVRGGAHSLWFEDGKVVGLDEERFAEKGYVFSVDCSNTFVDIEYPALTDIPADRRMLEENPSLAFDEFGDKPSFYLPIRKEHDLDCHEMITQLHQVRSESLDFVESLRTQ